MAVIVRKQPFYEQHTSVIVEGEPVRIKPYQIILWVSLAPPEERTLRPKAPRFPAILDLGHSHNFSLTEEHLTHWSRLDPRTLTILGAIRVKEQRLPLHSANVWLHSYRPGQRDDLGSGSPFCIPLDSGIAVYPTDASSAPRLPLLGLRGLRRADLQLHVDCRRCHVSLSTSRTSWFF